MAYLHFVTNFGRMHKQELTEFEWASMQSHLHFYADFEPIMHVLRGRLLTGLPAQVKQVEHEQPDYLVRHEKFYAPLADAAGDTDYIRAKALQEFGGLYADLDIFALQRFDFLAYNEVIGTESSKYSGTPNVGLLYARLGSVLPRLMLMLLNEPVKEEDLLKVDNFFKPYFYLQGRLRSHLQAFEYVAKPRIFHGSNPYWYKKGCLADHISKKAFSIHAFSTKAGEKIKQQNKQLYDELLSLHWL